MLSAQNGWSSVCAAFVHVTVCHCARVALVITVGSGAHVKAVKQSSERQVTQAGSDNNRTPFRVSCT